MAKGLLIGAGTLSAAVSALHFVIPVLGAPAYLYFGAGEGIAKAAEAGVWWPAGLTLCIAVVLLVFSAYAFAGASRFGPLPLLRTGLVVIGLIFTLRGMSVVPQAVVWLNKPGVLPGRYVVFSFVSLAIGVLYVAGTLAAWRTLSMPHT